MLFREHSPILPSPTKFVYTRNYSYFLFELFPHEFFSCLKLHVVSSTRIVFIFSNYDNAHSKRHLFKIGISLQLQK